MANNIELIGAGCIAEGTKQEGQSDFPVAYEPGAPLGQHLRIERLVRIFPDRMLYLANNISPLWNKRKCWACGNLYSPNRAQSCTLCRTPLRDRRFLVSVRWDQSLFVGFEGFYQDDLNQLRILQPAAISYRDRCMFVIYPYNGEKLLADEPAPVDSAHLLIVAHRLAGLLDVFHKRGAVLKPFTSSNIVKRPDGSPAWFDVNVERVVGSRSALSAMPSKPIHRDVRNLCEIMASFCNPANRGLVSVFERGLDDIDGYQSPEELVDAIEVAIDKYADFAEHNRIALFTDSGLMRALNEDSWSAKQLADGVMLYVCADGMGGHAGGEWASQEACRVITKFMHERVENSELEPLKKCLHEAIVAANRAVVAEGERRGASIGTTVVAAMVSFRKLLMAHVGDSRGYLFRDGQLTPLTKDHSLVGLWVESGKISREEARVHPKSNVLHSHIGQDDDLDIDLEVHNLKAGDRVVICSDGLWGELPESMIEAIVSRFPQPKDCVQQLVRAAYGAGGSDNTTVLVVDIP